MSQILRLHLTASLLQVTSSVWVEVCGTYVALRWKKRLKLLFFIRSSVVWLLRWTLQLGNWPRCPPMLRPVTDELTIIITLTLIMPCVVLFHLDFCWLLVGHLPDSLCVIVAWRSFQTLARGGDTLLTHNPYLLDLFTLNASMKRVESSVVWECCNLGPSVPLVTLTYQHLRLLLALGEMSPSWAVIREWGHSALLLSGVTGLMWVSSLMSYQQRLYQVESLHKVIFICSK